MTQQEPAPAASGSARWRRAKTVAGVIVVGACAVMIAQRLERVHDQLDEVTVHIDVNLFAGLGVYMLGQVIVGTLVWRSLVNAGASTSLRRVLHIYLVSQGLKYLPAGNMVNVGAQSYAFSKLPGVGPSVGVHGMVMFLAVHCAAAASFYGVVSSTLGPATWWSSVAIAALPLAIVGVCLLPKVFELASSFNIGRGLRQTQRYARPGPGALLGVSALGLFVWLVFGTSLAVIASSYAELDLTLFVQILGAFAGAWFVGFMAFVVPAGLGVRDVTLLAILTVLVGAPAAIAIAGVSRAACVVGDVLNVVVARGAMARSRQP